MDRAGATLNKFPSRDGLPIWGLTGK
jgi:hypothetical protein